MWVVRELLRLAARVAIAVAIAVAAGTVWSLAQHGSAAHRFQIAFLVVGAVVIALGAMGQGSAYQRDADVATARELRSFRFALPPRDETQPQLAPGAVLFLSGAIVIVLGFLV